MGLTKFKKKYEKKLKKIAQNFDLNYMVLFGSQSQNSDKKNSDFDIAYFRFEELNPDQKYNLYEKLQELFNEVSFDLVEINLKTSEVLKYEILSKGYCFYSKEKNVFETQKQQAFFSYIDSFSLLEPTKVKFLENV